MVKMKNASRLRQAILGVDGILADNREECHDYLESLLNSYPDEDKFGRKLAVRTYLARVRLALSTAHEGVQDLLDELE